MLPTAQRFSSARSSKSLDDDDDEEGLDVVGLDPEECNGKVSPAKSDSGSRKRAFDVSSLIGESSLPPPPKSKSNGSAQSTSAEGEKSYPSPNLSLGPPPPPPTHQVPPPGLYPYLLQSGLYQHLMAAAASAPGAPLGVPPGVPPVNPMLLNAQMSLNPFLASAYAANLAGMRQPGRFPAYPAPSSAAGSAFHPIAPKSSSPPTLGENRNSSPTSNRSPEGRIKGETSSSSSRGSSSSTSDIRGMENLVSGLSAGSNGAPGLSAIVHNPKALFGGATTAATTASKT